MENLSNNMSRLHEIMLDLVGKRIKLNMKNGWQISVYLKELLPTELIVVPSKTDKKIGIIPTDSINYLLEIADEDEWNEEES
jgi:hypothetical protein